MRLPRITYFLADDGACGWYRLTLPMTTLDKQKLAEVCRIAKGDPFEHIEEALAADMFVIPRLCERGSTGLLATLRDSGNKKPIVIDFDDDLFNIHPYSSHYQEFGTEEIKAKLNGDLIDIWTDGKNNFHIPANMERLEGIKRACREADMITVTTPLLAEVYREYNSNVQVLPNCLKFSMWNRLPLKSHEPEIRMLWTGGSSHYSDWCLLADVLPKIMWEYQNLKLIIGGQKFDGTLKGIRPEQIEHKPWTPIQAHHLQCAIFDADFALIPLEDNEFNSRKSCIKWLEMAALKVPCVCSYVSPYKEIYDGTNAIMIENNSTDGWYEGIRTAIRGGRLRKSVGDEAYDYAIENFDIEKNAHLWVEAYEKCLATVGR